jgi:hypothetical protein
MIACIRRIALAALAVLSMGIATVQAQNCPPGYTNNGATCGRGADSMSNGGSRVADCPESYTNNGATCGRSAQTLPNGGSRVADCPEGYTNNGATCGRGADSMSNGGSRVADCPDGFKNMGASCYRAWPPKSLSMSSMTCHSDEFRSGARCYKNCPSGYTNTGVSCYRPPSTLGMDSMTCHSDEFKSGARCYEPCPEGFTNTGVSCYRGPSTLGMSAMTCSAEEFKSGARCYKPCQLGYTNTGASCFRPASTLPRSADINWITPSEVEKQPFYNIGHMANTDAAAVWAAQQGANGLEMDLHFDESGNPTEFRHGGVCDCSCAKDDTTLSGHICANGLDNSCEAKSGAAEHLNTIATLRNLALVYIDSKVDKDTNVNAGTQVVKLLEEQLFAKGYVGIVVVSAPKIEAFGYLQAAAQAAATAPHRDRFFFALDGVQGSPARGKAQADEAIDKLQGLPATANLAYSNGISSCLADTFYREMSEGVRRQVAGDLGMVSIWTLDLERSMLNYLNIGVRGIVSNKPGVLNRVVRERVPELSLALPTDSPPLRKR